MASWFLIHYRKLVTSNTFQFRDDSESKSVMNKTFCSHRLHWFKKIKSDLLFSNAEWNYNREREKSKYLDNISVLPTSIFIFDKFVDGEIAGRQHILRTLCWLLRQVQLYNVLSGKGRRLKFTWDHGLLTPLSTTMTAPQFLYTEQF